jgi:hypothetical protein
MEKFGDPIPGSRFFRAFCARCGQPVRVTGETIQRAQLEVLSGDFDVDRLIYCEECAPQRPSQLAENLTLRQRLKLPS